MDMNRATPLPRRKPSRVRNTVGTLRARAQRRTAPAELCDLLRVAARKSLVPALVSERYDCFAHSILLMPQAGLN